MLKNILAKNGKGSVQVIDNLWAMRQMSKVDSISILTRLRQNCQFANLNRTTKHCINIFIMYLHYEPTSCIYIMYLHYTPTSCTYIMCLHYATTLCNYIMHLHYATTLCNYIMYLHYETTLCTYNMHLHYVPTLSNYIMYLHYGHCVSWHWSLKPLWRRLTRLWRSEKR